jgi:effector-binding domain-containing protein
MIIKIEKQNGIDIIYVRADIPDEEMEKLKNKLIERSSIKDIIKNDCDVYTEDNILLLKYRKNKLDNKNIDEFYNNVINFAKKSYTTNRGSVCGSNKKNLLDNPKVFSNVIGYMDDFSAKQKFLLKQQNKTVKYNVRECRFNADYPEKYKNLMPLIHEIDDNYKKLIPENYKKQLKKANETLFRISNTSFTTITTNVNFQTSIHRDKGDDEEGFGNLCVIENGEYNGAETCFPQYGIGVDVRNGDILFMDVHKYHGNLPMVSKNNDVIRLSIVCYLRHNVWKNTLNITKEEMIKHNELLKSIKKIKKKG